MTWPSIMGEIIKSNIEKSDDVDDITIQLRIIYAYNIEKFPFQSSRIRIGLQWAMEHGDESDVEHLLSKYPQNQQVQIYYNRSPF